MHSFFAMIARMRYITRWGLMRNTFPENIQEHSHMVAVLAHALAVIGRDVLGKRDLDPDAVAVFALYHDAPEILTGDLPTPVKYHNLAIRDAYRRVEAISADKLLHMLPEALRPSYAPLLCGPPEAAEPLVKAADKLSAYLKCVEELKAGNREFRKAADQLHDTLHAMRLPELDYFIAHFLPAFELTLDELE